MASTKGILEDAFLKYDVTQQPQATTQQDVINQDRPTRLWQATKQAYESQQRASTEATQQSYSQQSRHDDSRGMGRSSYSSQTLANILQKGIDSKNQIYANMIADYQNRLSDLEQQEQQQANWEAQFAYQKERDKEADRQWQLAFDAQQAANAAASKGSSGGGGGSGGTTAGTANPWELLGMTEDQFNAFVAAGNVDWMALLDAYRSSLPKPKITTTQSVYKPNNNYRVEMSK